MLVGRDGRMDLTFERRSLAVGPPENFVENRGPEGGKRAPCGIFVLASALCGLGGAGLSEITQSIGVLAVLCTDVMRLM